MSLFYPLITCRPLSAEASSYGADGNQRPRWFYSGRFSDSRIILPAAPSRPNKKVSGIKGVLEKEMPFQIVPAAVVPDHSGGPVPVFKGVPF